MPRRSKVELSEETISELEEQFFKFLNSLSPEETNRFFNEFLTGEEKMMMYKRLALYWSLFEGYSLASIQRMLGITHDTTRIYNKKKNEMSNEFKDLLHRIGRSNIQEVKPLPKEKPMEEEQPEVKEEAQEMMDKPEEKMEEEKEEMMDKHDEEENKDEEKMDMSDQKEDVVEAQVIEEPLKNDNETEILSKEEEKEEEMKTSENDESNDNEEKDENGEPKKKKGFGRFFGF